MKNDLALVKLLLAEGADLRCKLIRTISDVPFLSSDEHTDIGDRPMMIAARMKCAAPMSPMHLPHLPCISHQRG